MNMYFVAVTALVMAPSIIKALRSPNQTKAEQPEPTPVAVPEAEPKPEPKPAKARNKNSNRGRKKKKITLISPTNERMTFYGNVEASRAIGCQPYQISDLRTGRQASLKGWMLPETAFTHDKYYVRCAKKQLNGRYKHLRFENVIAFGDYFQLDSIARTKALKSGSYDGWDVMLSKKQK
jgi:hypothetical protein